ncbi:MAG: hypothetical protein RLZZ70_440 [Candidatus Parcubacteria bacterium]|jgi:hypothetical protein
MTKQTTTTTILAGCYCALFVGVLVYAVIHVRALGVTYTTLTTTLAEQQAKQQAARTINQLVSSTESDRSKLATFLVTKQDTIALITEIESLAKATGVAFKMQNLAILEKSDSTPEALQANFEISGSRLSVQRFIQALEVLPYHTQIPRMQVNRDGDVWQGTIELLVTLSA